MPASFKRKNFSQWPQDMHLSNLQRQAGSNVRPPNQQVSPTRQRRYHGPDESRGYSASSMDDTNMPDGVNGGREGIVLPRVDIYAPRKTMHPSEPLYDRRFQHEQPPAPQRQSSPVRRQDNNYRSTENPRELQRKESKTKGPKVPRKPSKNNSRSDQLYYDGPYAKQHGMAEKSAPYSQEDLDDDDILIDVDDEGQVDIRAPTFGGRPIFSGYMPPVEKTFNDPPSRNGPHAFNDPPSRNGPHTFKDPPSRNGPYTFNDPPSRNGPQKTGQNFQDVNDKLGWSPSREQTPNDHVYDYRELDNKPIKERNRSSKKHSNERGRPFDFGNTTEVFMPLPHAVPKKARHTSDYHSRRFLSLQAKQKKFFIIFAICVVLALAGAGIGVYFGVVQPVLDKQSTSGAQKAVDKLESSTRFHTQQATTYYMVPLDSTIAIPSKRYLDSLSTQKATLVLDRTMDPTSSISTEKVASSSSMISDRQTTMSLFVNAGERASATSDTAGQEQSTHGVSSVFSTTSILSSPTNVALSSSSDRLSSIAEVAMSLSTSAMDKTASTTSLTSPANSVQTSTTALTSTLASINTASNTAITTVVPTPVTTPVLMLQITSTPVTTPVLMLQITSLTSAIATDMANNFQTLLLSSTEAVNTKVTITLLTSLIETLAATKTESTAISSSQLSLTETMDVKNTEQTTVPSSSVLESIANSLGTTTSMTAVPSLMSATQITSSDASSSSYGVSNSSAIQNGISDSSFQSSTTVTSIERATLNNLQSTTDTQTMAITADISPTLTNTLQSSSSDENIKYTSTPDIYISTTPILLYATITVDEDLATSQNMEGDASNNLQASISSV